MIAAWLGVALGLAGAAIAVWGFRRRGGLESRRLASLGTVDAHRERFRG